MDALSVIRPVTATLNVDEGGNASGTGKSAQNLPGPISDSFDSADSPSPVDSGVGSLSGMQDLGFRITTAITAYTEAIRLDPKDARAYNSRGWAYHNLKDYARAIADYTDAIRHSDSSISKAYVYVNRAAAKWRSNDSDPEGAIADCMEAIRLDPGYATAYYNLGAAELALKNYDKAINACTKAIGLEPKNEHASAYCCIGAAKLELKDYAGAIEACKNAIRLDPEYATAYRNRAYAYQNLGKVNEAKSDFEQVLRLADADPKTCESARQALANLEQQ